jgi:hypothetical protein
MLRTVYGNVPMRVRRLRGCGCALDSASRSAIFTNRNAITPELKYLTAKLAALMPFGRVADFLSELLPLSTKAAPGTISQSDDESRPRASEFGQQGAKPANGW